MYGKCEEKVSQKKIVLSERKAKLIFLNNSKMTHRKIKIDNCVITDGLRCDYLFITDKNSEYYIELKGSDVKQGIKQLERTIEYIQSSNRSKRTAVIIYNLRCPITTTEIQNYKKIFKVRFKISLEIKKSGHEISL